MAEELDRTHSKTLQREIMEGRMEGNREDWKKLVDWMIED